MPNPRVLLIGGHGRISLLLTPKLLSRSFDVISLIRSSSQIADIQSAAALAPSSSQGKIETLVRSIEDVKSEADARSILDEAKADWVVWSAGAGGKGGQERTYAVDRDACIHFISAYLSSPRTKKFLLVSALSVRRNKASWWSPESYALVQKINTEIMPHYYAAKLAADEYLAVKGAEHQQRSNELVKKVWISLRPGGLGDGEETGKVDLGMTEAKGVVSRGDVAEVAARLLEGETSGWFDLLGGEEDVDKAVARVLKGGVNSIEGESLEVMKANLVG